MIFEDDPVESFINNSSDILSSHEVIANENEHFDPAKERDATWKIIDDWFYERFSSEKMKSKDLVTKLKIQNIALINYKRKLTLQIKKNTTARYS